MSVFEMGMLICFGLAWPVNIYKSVKSKSTKGKSVMFLLVIWLGYIFGIIHKLINNLDIVLWLYVLNLAMVSVDIVLFIYNRRNELRNETPAQT
jgi:hypothetical protein